MATPYHHFRTIISTKHDSTRDSCFWNHNQRKRNYRNTDTLTKISTKGKCFNLESNLIFQIL